MGVLSSSKLSDDWKVITENKCECNIGKYFEHLSEPVQTKDKSQAMYSKSKRRFGCQGQTKVNLNSFAPTMRAEHHGNIEFRRFADNDEGLPERRLTVREAGLIQTFPPDFIFTVKGTMTSYKYIGNAVPPLLAYLIARKVKSVLTHTQIQDDYLPPIL